LFYSKFLPSLRAAPLLGLDVSATGAKLVQLGQEKNGQWRLEHCAFLPFQPGWVVDGHIENSDLVADTVRQLVTQSGVKTKNVAMALPPTTVITKKITLPRGLSEQEQLLQVEIEVAQYIPFSLDELSLDFCELVPRASNPNSIDVLIAASRRENVQDIEDLAEAAGLQTVVVDVASYASRLALIRLIERLPRQGLGCVVALFDLGALSTSLCVICDDEVLYERDQSFQQAMETSLLEPLIERLALAINRALQDFFASTTHHQVDYVMLAGDAASVPGLVRAVAALSRFPCKLVNPFEDMVILQTTEWASVSLQAPAYLTACGLAMRRFAK
jgi:type IV pilus assembly protein PilM